MGKKHKHTTKQVKSEKLPRQQVEDRARFSCDDKSSILKKTNGRCAHCGKIIFASYNTTVDHFIPLSLGGTNRDINTVPMCEKCNQEKGNLIYNPEDFLPFLLPDYIEPLREYFESYISSFEFVNRNNLLACDRYGIQYYLALHSHGASHKRSIPFQPSSWFKRATMQDAEKLTAYLIKYLKRHDALESEEAAEKQILFWLTFGCIYYIEEADNVRLMMTATIKEEELSYSSVSPSTPPSYLNCNIFAYYNTNQTKSTIRTLIQTFPVWILREQKLKQIPILFRILKQDSNNITLYTFGKSVSTTKQVVEIYYIFHEGNCPPIKDDEDFQKFLTKFKVLTTERIQQWILVHGKDHLEWLSHELFSYDIGTEANK